MSAAINLMLIASGGGTDADAIMTAWRQGQIPEVGNVILVSTRAGAGCLEKAAKNDVKSIVAIPPSIPLKLPSDKDIYRKQLSDIADEYDTDLIFLVGCIVVLPLIGIPMHNIHPADTVLHGGDTMHSLAVHEHVLAAAIDEIKRGKRKIGRDRFYTYPTVHEAHEIPDDGPPLLRGSVEIPLPILLGIQSGQYSLKEAAQELQKAVLPYEWMMLPVAVRMAASRILRRIG